MVSSCCVQVVQQKGLTEPATCLTSEGAIVVAAGASGSIHSLQPLPFRPQAEQLAALGQFQEALQLAALIPDAQVRHLLSITTDILISLPSILCD